MKPRLSSICLVVTALCGPIAFAQFAELTSFLNGRSGANFLKTENNIQFVVNPGTQGEVLGIKTFNSGNQGIQLRLTNGSHAGETVWVYLNRSNPGLKFYDANPSGPAQEAAVPAPGNVAQATQKLTAIPEPGIPREPSIVESRIQLASAIACFGALAKAQPALASYPEGFAVVAKRSPEPKGALVFNSQTAELKKDLLMSDSGDFLELVGTDPIPMSPGAGDLTPRNVGILAQNLTHQMRLLLESSAAPVVPASVADTGSDSTLKEAVQSATRQLGDHNPSTPTQEQLEAFSQMSLKQDQERGTSDRPFEVTATTRGLTESVTSAPGRTGQQPLNENPSDPDAARTAEHIAKNEKLLKAVEAEPKLDPRPTAVPVDRAAFIAALNQCKKVQDEPQVANYASQVLERLLESASGAGAVAEPKAPVDASRAN